MTKIQSIGKSESRRLSETDIQLPKVYKNGFWLWRGFKGWTDLSKFYSLKLKLRSARFRGILN